MISTNIQIPPTRYEIWGWPAAANLILGGTACGFFLLSMLNIEAYMQDKAVFALLRSNIISPILVALGLLTVGIEAGRPLRGIFLFHHLKRSWMSREVLAGMLFILFALSDAVLPNVAFKSISVAAAMGFMLCQGFMVYRAKAVTAWISYLIPLYFITSGLILGFGFLLFWSTAFVPTDTPATTLLLGLFGLLANLILWHMIVKPKTIASEDRSVIHLRNTLSMTMTFGFGHLVPILLLLAILIFSYTHSFDNATFALSMITGACIFAGGITQKIGVILQANAIREIRSGKPQHQVPSCPGPQKWYQKLKL